MAVDGSTLAELVRTWRTRIFLTQQQLADRTGLGVRTIRRLEADGLRRPRADSLRLLADALQLNDSERSQLISAAAQADAAVELDIPRQLPRDLPGFCGRAEELAMLDTQLHETERVAVILVCGMAGVGKTTLALRWAHKVHDSFPDGQIFLDLHGYTEGVAPVRPADALNRTLRLLGVPAGRIPSNFDDLTALWRSTLAERRMLILLDNAAQEAQVQPLLPGTGGTLVMITSRQRLSGLDDAHLLALDLLPADDALELLTSASGRKGSEEAAGEIVERCGRLPLAIRIAAARLKARPAWTVEHLAEQLSDHRRRLSELETGQRSVAAALDLSYHHLTPDLQRCHRLLGLPTGEDIDTRAAAALAGTSPEAAQRLLVELVDAHLLNEALPGRYTMHDLVRAHAIAACTRDESMPERQAAIDRLLGHYLHRALAAARRAYPYEADYFPALKPSTSDLPSLADPAEASRWLDDELTNLLASAELALGDDRPGHVVALSAILSRHLRMRGHSETAERLQRQALECAVAVGDRGGELLALNSLGNTLTTRGEPDLAGDVLERALSLGRELGDVAGEIAALISLGALAYYQTRHELATQRLEQVLTIARAAGRTRAELLALGNLGNIHRLHGRIEAAAGCYRQALGIARAIGDRNDEIKALVGLGHMHRLEHNLAAAGQTYREALHLTRAVGDREAELLALWGVAAVHRALDRHTEALACFGELLELAERGGNANSEFEAHHGLGHTHRRAGRPQEAIHHHEQALRIARRLNQPDDQARAHDGLALTHEARGRLDAATEHWRAALQIMTELGLREVEEVRAENIRAKLAGLV